jgi:hypothetical protein
MTAPLYQMKAFYVTQNTVPSGGSLTNGFAPFSTVAVYFPLIRGNNILSTWSGAYTGNSACIAYSLLGNNGCTVVTFDTGNAPSLPTSDLVVIAFNTTYKTTTQVTVSTGAGGGIFGNAVVTGGAIVQNMWESTGNIDPVLWVTADSAGEASICNSGGSTDNTLCPVNNVIIQHNTIAGERTNMGYNEYSNAGSGGHPADNNYRLNWSVTWNLFSASGTDSGWNCKTDTFTAGPPDGARVNNWAACYLVGAVGNVAAESQQNFPPDFNGIGSPFNATLPSVQFFKDNSTSGTGTGNGNYRIPPTSVAYQPCTTCSAANEVISYDLAGVPRTGIPNAGAYTMGTGLLVAPEQVVLPKQVIFQ